MKGWVYVISNPAMPGLVKVGYSAKDPDLRAEELNHTGSPHPYTVEYDVLIEEPYQVEQRAHKYLHNVRAGKEWFRCNAEEAIAAIQRAANGAAIVENFKRAHREKAERIRREHEAEEQRQKAAAERQRAIEAQVQEQENAIHKKYEQYLSTEFPETPFWQYWLGCAIAISFLVVMLVTKISDNGVFWLSTFGGAFTAFFVKGYFEDKKKESSAYRSILQKREVEIEAVRRQQSKVSELVHVQSTEGESFNDKAMLVYRHASDGDARAQFNLGYMYFKGDGVVKNAAKAMKWYEKAAAQGNARAQFYLGLMYLDGVGVPKDLAKAVEWHTKSVNRGNPTEQNWPGGAAEQSWLKQRIDEENALMELTKKAGSGSPQAQLKLGDIYANDYDFDQAIEWYTRAADQGLDEARARVKNICRIREGVPPAEVSSPPELSEEVMPISPAEILTTTAISNLHLSSAYWPIGQTVFHPKFGQGVILSYQENQGYQASSTPTVKINFATAGEKLLVLAYARLTVMGNSGSNANKTGLGLSVSRRPPS